jgi:hypothetical protein
MKTCNRLACAVLLAATSISPVASGQVGDEAAARSLFDEGRKLLRAGDYAEACPKLEAAAQLHVSGGILLNLADCHEKVGRTASAWTEFGDAAAAAARINRKDQVAEARRRQAALEPKLTRLTVRVVHQQTGLVVKRDGVELAEAAWGSAIPVDPGTHAIQAEAPGRESWTTSVTVPTPGQTISVDVTELAETPATPTPPITQGEGAERSNSRSKVDAERPPSKRRSHVLDWTLVVAGAAVAIGGAALTGIESNRAHGAYVATSDKQTFDASQSTYNSAKTPYYAGLASVIVGGVAVVSGVLLLTTSHGEERTATASGVEATPWMGAHGAGVQLGGAW